MIRVIYRRKLPAERVEESTLAWREVTTSVHGTTLGARGSFRLREIDHPEEILTIALWGEEEDWRDFIGTAKATSMCRLHEIGEQISAANSSFVDPIQNRSKTGSNVPNLTWHPRSFIIRGIERGPSHRTI